MSLPLSARPSRQLPEILAHHWPVLRRRVVRTGQIELVARRIGPLAQVELELAKCLERRGGQFLKAINAEGIGLGSYIRTGLHREPWVDHILGLKVYKSMYGTSRLKEYKEQLDLPNCDRICNETLVSFWGSGALLGTREEMDSIINAILKVYQNRDQLKAL